MSEVVNQNGLLRSFTEGKSTMEQARDCLWQILHNIDAESFPLTGHRDSEIFSLLKCMLEVNDGCVERTLCCQHCHIDLEAEEDNTILWDCSKVIWNEYPTKLGSHKERTIKEWLTPLFNRPIAQKCDKCKGNMFQ